MGNTDFILSRQGGGGQSILPCPACLSSGQGPGGRCCAGAFCSVVGVIRYYQQSGCVIASFHVSFGDLGSHF